MPPAWVDFSWAMVRGKRDDVKRISFIVIIVIVIVVIMLNLITKHSTRLEFDIVG
jgi:hypothetical protein